MSLSSWYAIFQSGQKMKLSKHHKLFSETTFFILLIKKGVDYKQ
jgi:hypothetical protein